MQALMKKCQKCKSSKPLDEFGVYAGSSDGRSHMCLPCKREYQRENYANSPSRRAYLAAKRKEVRVRGREFVLAYLLEHPCVDCGETDPVVLQFDHRGNKIANVAELVAGASIQRLAIEIAKCDVRCANCHSRKTARDFGWYKALTEVRSFL